jgi:hypothetical protein
MIAALHREVWCFIPAGRKPVTYSLPVCWGSSNTVRALVLKAKIGLRDPIEASLPGTPGSNKTLEDLWSSAARKALKFIDLDN